MRQPKHDSYGHGDARNALLGAAAALLEAAGAQGLSLRAVAARAGLSRQAPYNHFADKQALLAELAAEGFRRLNARICSTPGYPASAASLERAADAYVGFAQHSPTLFRVMFSRELVDLSRFPEAARVAEDAYQSPVVIVAAFTAPPRRRRRCWMRWPTCASGCRSASWWGSPTRCWCRMPWRSAARRAGRCGTRWNWLTR
ncbi:MAG: TetR/AcrR family transcriptional regulator [Rhodanobacteraceae bacterium]